jgi:hypothetical protein
MNYAMEYEKVLSCKRMMEAESRDAASEHTPLFRGDVMKAVFVSRRPSTLHFEARMD